MNDERFRGIDHYEDDLMGVLMALKANIFRDLKVATLGKITEISGDIYKAKIFPLMVEELEKNINCYKLKEILVEKNDIVLILFLDRNFLQNLNQIKNEQNLSALSKDTELHLDKYGIIIGTL